MSLRERLRATPVFPAGIPGFDPARAPADPLVLFEEWFAQAVDAGQGAAQAMTLSTAGASCRVSARTLILKDIDDRGWQFATHSTSPKAIDLAANPSAALTFFWPVVGRQVRVSGTTTLLPRGEAEADFLARPLDSRVATLVGRQSEPLGAPAELARAAREARTVIERDPSTVDAGWALYAVRATRIEFWQASHDRAHTRLVYRLAGVGAWTRKLLWP